MDFPLPLQSYVFGASAGKSNGAAKGKGVSARTAATAVSFPADSELVEYSTRSPRSEDGGDDSGGGSMSPLATILSPPTFSRRKSRAGEFYDRFEKNPKVDHEISLVADEILDQKKTIQEVIQMNTYYSKVRRSTLGSVFELVPSTALARYRAASTTHATTSSILPLATYHKTKGPEGESPFLQYADVKAKVVGGTKGARQQPLQRVDYTALIKKQQEEYQKLELLHDDYLQVVATVVRERAEFASRLESLLAPHEWDCGAGAGSPCAGDIAGGQSAATDPNIETIPATLEPAATP